MSTIEIEDTFPLWQWFDLSKRITKDEIETCCAQMALYCLKDGGKPDTDSGFRESCRQLKQAVKLHNTRLSK